MKIILVNYGDISDLVQKDDILFLVSQLPENQEVSEEFSIRIADPDGSIETYLTQYGANASIEVYDDQNTLISTYYFTGRYERTQEFYFVDAFFRKEIIPADAIAGRTGFFDINVLFSKVFNVSSRDILLPGATDNAYLNIYNTIPEIPVSGYSGVSMVTYGDYVFFAHQDILIRYQKSTNTYQAFTIRRYSPTSALTTKPSRQVYFSQSSAPIQAKILGFRVESNIPYIYILTDEIYYNVIGMMTGFYTIRKFRADFTDSPSYILVKEQLFASGYTSGITNVMLCDLSTVIPMGVQSSSGNFDYLVWLQVKKDTSSPIASTVNVYLMDMNFMPGSPVTTIQADLRRFNQNLRRYSDSYFYDSTKWAVVWNCFVIVKWGTSYHAHQISASQNCGDVTVFYESAQGRFKACIEASSKIVEVFFPFDTTSPTPTFKEFTQEGFMIGGRNARISLVYSQSSAYEFFERQLGGQRPMPHLGLNVFDLGYIYSDAFIGFVDSYAVVGFIQSQPNVSVYVSDANTKLPSLVGEVKRILADTIIYDTTTKQFYSISSRTPSGTITQDDYSQYKEEAFTRNEASCLATFADGHTGRIPYEERTLELSFMYAFQGWHLFKTFTQWKKYEILSSRNDLYVGLVYTFTDQEGRSQSVVVKKKYLEFSGLWRYELATINYPSTIDYQLPGDTPSWLVLNVDFNHRLVEYGTHFEHTATISWRSMGVEHPYRMYYTVIDVISGDIILDGWNFISSAGTYPLRWTSLKLSNYRVLAKFRSTHDEDDYEWDVNLVEGNEPPKTVSLSDVANFVRNPIFYNPNAHFINGMTHWSSTSRRQYLEMGDEIITEDFYPVIYPNTIFTNIYLNLTGEYNSRVRLFIKLYNENFGEVLEETIPIDVEFTPNMPVEIWKSYEHHIANTEPTKYYRVGLRNVSNTTVDSTVRVNVFGLFYYNYANYAGSSYSSDTLDGHHASEFPLLSGNNTFTGMNTFGGSVAFPIISTDSNLTLTNSHYTVLVSAFDSNITITLPNASGINGRIYVIKRIDNRAMYSVVIQAQSGQTIDGASSISLSTQYATVVIQAYGGNWHILSKTGV